MLSSCTEFITHSFADTLRSELEQKATSIDLFLAVQNSSIGDLVTHSLTESLTVLLLLRYKERPQRPVTFETFDQSDEET